MKAKLEMFQMAGLSFSEIGGRLKVVGIPATVEKFRAEILENKRGILKYLGSEKPFQLQADSGNSKTLAMQSYGNSETNAPQATPEQVPEGYAEKLAAWERGELVKIPHTAEALEMNRAIELEALAMKQGAKFAAAGLGRLLAVADVAQTTTALDAACHELREFIDTG